MYRLDIGLLGEPRIAFDAAPWRVSAPPKCLPLLALIALRRGPVPRALLASMLWPDDTESSARANLRRHLHQLVKSLPSIDGVPWILSATTSLEWNPAAPARIDALEFIDAAGDPSRREEAAAMYAGDLLASTFDDAIIAERERLRMMHVELLADLAIRARAERDYAAARRYADTMLACDEWREDALRLAMEVRYLAGDRSGALAVFGRFARRLSEELHTEPMRETIALRDSIVANAALEDRENEPVSATARVLMIGREEELGRALEAWRGAARGSGSVLFVAGEAGIGKSRFVTEIMANVESQGGRAVLGRTSRPESFAYQPLVEALRRLVPFLPHDGEDRAWLPALVPLLPELASLRDDGHESLQRREQSELRLKEAVLRMLASCARLRPLTIVMEDLHLANDATIDVIASIGERLAGLPILIVLTYRSEDARARAPVRVLRRKLQREGRARQITLGRLEQEQVQQLVSSAGGDIDYGARVFHASKGNPLFAWQLIRAKNERSDHVQPAHDTVTDALIERLGALPDDVRLVADVAALIGDTFTVEEVSEIGGWSEADSVAALGVLLERQFVSERTGTSFEYSFTHALIATTLYERLVPHVRAMRHRRAAEVLTQTRAEHGYEFGLIAEHWLRAGDISRARASLIRAAEQLLTAHARPDARLYAERVLALNPLDTERFAALLLIIKSINKTGASRIHADLLSSLDTLAAKLGIEERLEALGARVEYYNETGDRDNALVTAEQLRLLAVAHGDQRWINQATLHGANFALYSGEPARSENILRKLHLESLSEPQKNEYFRQLTQSFFRQLRFDEGRTLLSAFREHLTLHPSVSGEYAYASAEMTGAWLMDDPVHLKTSAERVVHLAHIRGDILDEARARSNLAYVRHQLHETSAARAEYERTLELYERGAHRQNVLIARLNYAMIEFETGHIDRAETQWRDIAREVEREAFLSRTFAIGIAINLAEVGLYRGDVQSALVHAEHAYEESSASKETWIRVNAQAVLGAAKCASGEVEEGLRMLAETLVAAREQARAYIDYATMYVTALVDAKRVEESAKAAKDLYDAFSQDPLDQQYPGRVCWALARAASLREDRAEHDRLIAWGRELVETRADAFDDEPDREAYASMWPNHLLLAHTACANGVPAR